MFLVLNCLVRFAVCSHVLDCCQPGLVARCQKSVSALCRSPIAADCIYCWLDDLDSFQHQLGPNGVLLVQCVSSLYKDQFDLRSFREDWFCEIEKLEFMINDLRLFPLDPCKFGLVFMIVAFLPWSRVDGALFRVTEF
mgnify:CR=1 FL=1